MNKQSVLLDYQVERQVGTQIRRSSMDVKNLRILIEDYMRCQSYLAVMAEPWKQAWERVSGPTLIFERVQQQVRNQTLGARHG